jgi:16S rRNA (guanine527-N7)-methyltransferase
MSRNDERNLEQSLTGLGITLAKPVIGDLLCLRDELLRWNRRVNLTAITDPEEALEKHLLDSLTVLPEIEPTGRLLDLGSGGGFPGLPLRLACPHLRVLSVDAVQKKIAFQRHMVRRLGLEGFTAWHGRAEKLPDHPEFAGGFERVVSRAFASLEDFVRLALPCLAPHGRIVAMKGQEGERELAAAMPVLSRLGLSCLFSRRLELPGSGARRTLIVLARSEPKI